MIHYLFRLIFIGILLLQMSAVPCRADLQWCAFHQGILKAHTEKKPVMIKFESPACHSCEQLDSVLATPAIEEKLESFVVIKMDIFDNKAPLTFKGKPYTLKSFMKSFDVRGRPSLLFLTTGGEKIASFKGVIRPKKMLRILDSVKEHIHKSS